MDAQPTPPRPPRTPAPSVGLPFAGLIGWVLVGTLVIALAMVLVYVVVRMTRNRLPDVEEDDDGDVVVEPLTRMIDRAREPRSWREEAEAHLAAGRHREAIRCRYRALVGDLARRGLLDEIPGRTTGEEREQLRDEASPAAEPFARATGVFDEVWYGSHPAGRVDYERFGAAEAEVLERSTRRPVAAR